MDHEIQNPSAVYEAGRRTWDERYGSHITNAKRWRFAFAVSMVLTTVSTGLLCWQSTQSRVVPYVVMVNNLGEAVAAHRLPTATPPDVTVIKAQLARWVVDMRTVFNDPSAQKQFAQEAFDWVDRISDAKAQLTDWYQTTRPLERSKSEVVGVKIENVGQIGDQSYSIDWIEEHRYSNGNAPTDSAWRAQIKIKINPPHDDASILRNPEGVYVTWYNVTQRLGRV